MTPPNNTRVLVIGGYGTFGLRLVKLLSDQPGMTVFVAGRSEAKAFKAVTPIQGASILIPTVLDRGQPIDHPPVDVVVDAVGPFQAYGAARDHVFDYCERVGATYVDLSDDPDFCAHIMARAQSAAVTVATGWSTYAAVTGAAIHALGESSIPPKVGIVPSPKLPMGRAVIASVLDSAGKDIGPPMGGRGARGLTRTLRRTVAPPGMLPMRNLLFSNVPAPDSVLIDPDMTAWVAPQPEILHRVLIFMARLRGWRLLPPLRWFAGLIHRVQSVVRIGEPRGGLFVEVDERRFDLIGEGDTGPYVPATPAAALIRALHAGERFAPGLLRPGADFPLSRLTPVWDEIGIAHGIRTRSQTLYADTLGGAMAELPEPIADLHEGGVFRGRATVERGRNPLGRIVASVMAFPKAGQHDLRVSITTDEKGREHWSRVYAGRVMFSTQERGRGRTSGLIVERFGPFAVHLAIFRDGDRLRYLSRGWSFFNIPLPRCLAPGGDVHEFVDEQGRFNFHVDMRAPGFGRLVRYRGWLIREPEAG